MGNPVYVHPFASSATEVFQRFTILMRSDASLLTYNRSIVLYADNPVLGRTLTSLAGYVIWYSFPVSWLVGDGCIGKKVIAKLEIITNLVSISKTQSTTYSESSALHKELT